MPSGNSGSSGNIPPPPQYGPSYQQGIDVYLKNLDQMLAREQSSRNIYDPQRIQEQQTLQGQFGPMQYSQMLQALGQLDPQWMGLRSQLGDKLSGNLANGTPLQAGADKLLGSLSNDYYNGTALDKSANQQLTGSEGLLANLKKNYYGGSDSTNQAKALLGDLQSQYNLGTQLSPDQEQELEQQTRRTQASRGNVYGQAPVEAEAFTKGQRGLDLQQQRLGNLEGGMGLYNQYGQQDLSNYLSGFQNNAANIGLVSNLKQQEFGNLMGGFNQSNALNQQNYSNIGSFLSGPSVAQQASFVPPVSADRSMAYVDPNAGFQGSQFALQNYQNLLGQYGLQNQGSGSNPWMSTIGSIASIAGPILGGLAFSDKRLKTDVKHVGNAHGIPIKEYAFKGDPSHREVGVIAQDVAKTRPDAVSRHPSGMLQVNYRKLGLPLPQSTDTQPAMIGKDEVVLNRPEQAQVGLDRIMAAVGNRHGKPLGGGVRGYMGGGWGGMLQGGAYNKPWGQPQSLGNSMPGSQWGGPQALGGAQDGEGVEFPAANMGADPLYPSNPNEQAATLPSGSDPNVVTNPYDTYNNNQTPPMNIPFTKPPGLQMPPNQQPPPAFMRFMPPIVQGAYGGYRLAQRLREMYSNYRASHPGGEADNPSVASNGPPGEGGGGYYDPSYLMSIGYRGGQGTGSLWPDNVFNGVRGGPLPGSSSIMGGWGGSISGIGGKLYWHKAQPMFGGRTLAQVAKQNPELLPGLKNMGAGFNTGGWKGTKIGAGGVGLLANQ